MSIDYSKHSPFGVSKTSADLMVQEYGKYFGIKSVSFRCGVLLVPDIKEQNFMVFYLI